MTNIRVNENNVDDISSLQFHCRSEAFANEDELPVPLFDERQEVSESRRHHHGFCLQGGTFFFLSLFIGFADHYISLSNTIVEANFCACNFKK